MRIKASGRALQTGVGAGVGIGVIVGVLCPSLLLLTAGAAALQMETDDLSMTLDVETGEADAVILKGDHSGRIWSSLTNAEKAEVALFLTDGAGSILKIPAAASGE